MITPSSTQTPPPELAGRSTSPDTSEQRLGRLGALIRHRPLRAFLVLACLLSWWPAALYAAGWSPIPIFSGGPFLAALVVVWLTAGRAGLKVMWHSMTGVRGHGRHFMLAIATPILITATALAATIFFAGATPDPAMLKLWTEVPITFFVVLLVPAFGGAWEEPGFRGFALSPIEREYGALRGQLTLGAFWVLWHAPLFIAGQILWTDILVIVAASIIIATLFHRSADSILVAMVVHASNNAFAGAYASQLFSGHDKVVFGGILALTWTTAAAVVVRLRREAATDPGLGGSAAR